MIVRVKTEEGDLYDVEVETVPGTLTVTEKNRTLVLQRSQLRTPIHDCIIAHLERVFSGEAPHEIHSEELSDEITNVLIEFNAHLFKGF